MLLAFAVLVLAALAGGVAGAAVSFAFPARLDLAGGSAKVWLVPGRAYDQVSLSGAVSARRATSRAVVGEPIGVRLALEVDPSGLVDASGHFDPDVLPAYIQAYSDPAQILRDVQHALVRHVISFAATGAGIAVLLLVARTGYRDWRRRYDAAHWDPDEAATVRAYHRPERALRRRTAVGVVVLVVLASTSGSEFRPPPMPTITPNPVLASTPLAGAEIDGLLAPAVGLVRSYIETYFQQTDDYYDKLRTALLDYLTATPVVLPQGPDVTSFAFVTDRHCNVGMDRVIVALAKYFGITTLVSAGDDAFSGTFSFESACTSNLADRSKAAGITDVFVGGNHDSPMTLADEREQGIRVLNGSVISAHGLRFLGSSDPRTSRYGQGIVPSAPQAQARLITRQAAAVGRTACATNGPLIAVLHDPAGGQQALSDGCGRITLALDGHTHVQSGPNLVPLPDGSTGYQYTGASSGGAPSEYSVERTFASALTVGPLNHDATVNLVTVDPSTDKLVAMTVFRFTPEQQISVEYVPVPSG